MSARASSVRVDADARLVVQVWLGTRLLLLITAVLVALRTGRRLPNLLGNWDVAHFVAIAKNGYAVQTDMAFFPGLPLVLSLAYRVGADPVIWGTVLALVTSALATWALYRIGGRWAAIAWLLAPTSVFTLVPYSEAPFCAAAFWAWERATRKHWGAAAVLAGLACTLRVSGLFLVGALAVLAVSQAWTARRASGLVRSLPWLLLPLGVLASYAVYLYGRTGSWTAWFSAQAAGWKREFTWPWDCVMNSWRSLQPGMYADHPEWVWIFRAEFLSMIVGVLVVIVLLLRWRVPEASWVGVQVLAFSISYWFQSVCRAVLLWFPLWTLIGEFVEPRTRGAWRWFWAVVIVVALTVQVGWSVLFYLGMWAS
ncbi:MAG TPA: mannosyltransferase family protein [Propioniciclava tarda]|nr:mannosyltransferase family protein [Propioniciclava tarda]